MPFLTSVLSDHCFCRKSFRVVNSQRPTGAEPSPQLSVGTDQLFLMKDQFQNDKIEKLLCWLLLAWWLWCAGNKGRRTFHHSSLRTSILPPPRDSPVTDLPSSTLWFLQGSIHLLHPPSSEVQECSLSGELGQGQCSHVAQKVTGYAERKIHNNPRIELALDLQTRELCSIRTHCLSWLSSCLLCDHGKSLNLSVSQSLLLFLLPSSLYTN